MAAINLAYKKAGDHELKNLSVKPHEIQASLNFMIFKCLKRAANIRHVSEQNNKKGRP